MILLPDSFYFVEEALLPGVQLEYLHALQQLVHLLHANVLLFHHRHLNI